MGRNDDLICFLDRAGKKRVVFPDLIITESDLIREFQIVQDKIDKVTV